MANKNARFLLYMREDLRKIVEMTQVYQISEAKAKKMEKLAGWCLERTQRMLDDLALSASSTPPPASPSPSPHAERPGHATREE